MKLGETRLDGLNVFISGPVTGIDRDTAEARFASAALKCRQCGAKYAFNPMEAVPPDTSHQDAMCRCVNELTMWDFDGKRPYYGALVQLDGWSRSNGAVIENAVAFACGIRIVRIQDVGEVR